MPCAGSPLSVERYPVCRWSWCHSGVSDLSPTHACSRASSPSVHRSDRPGISAEVRRRLLGRSPSADPRLPRGAVRPQLGREDLSEEGHPTKNFGGGEGLQVDKSRCRRNRRCTPYVKCHSDGKMNGETSTGWIFIIPFKKPCRGETS